MTHPGEQVSATSEFPHDVSGTNSLTVCFLPIA